MYCTQTTHRILDTWRSIRSRAISTVAHAASTISKSPHPTDTHEQADVSLLPAESGFFCAFAGTCDVGGTAKANSLLGDLLNLAAVGDLLFRSMPNKKTSDRTKR
jgi:hypothetical protein